MKTKHNVDDIPTCPATYTDPEYNPAPEEGGHVWPSRTFHCALLVDHPSDHQTADGRTRWERAEDG